MKKETIEKFLLKGEKQGNFLISDVATYGCSGGTISELIYYGDTVKFHDKHEDEIWDELNESVQEQGGTHLSYLSCLKGGDQVDDLSTLKNLLSWWVCEVIAQRIMDEREDGSRKMDGFDKIDHLEKRLLADQG